MQNRALLRVNGLRYLSLSPWIRFGPRVMRVIHGTDHTSPANMVAVFNGSFYMVYDPDTRTGSWIYGPSHAETIQKNPGGVIEIEGLTVHKECLAWCDSFLTQKKVRSLPERYS